MSFHLLVYSFISFSNVLLFSSLSITWLSLIVNILSFLMLLEVQLFFKFPFQIVQCIETQLIFVWWFKIPWLSWLHLCSNRFSLFLFFVDSQVFTYFESSSSLSLLVSTCKYSPIHFRLFRFQNVSNIWHFLLVSLKSSVLEWIFVSATSRATCEEIIF